MHSSAARFSEKAQKRRLPCRLARYGNAAAHAQYSTVQQSQVQEKRKVRFCFNFKHLMSLLRFSCDAVQFVSEKVERGRDEEEEKTVLCARPSKVQK